MNIAEISEQHDSIINRIRTILPTLNAYDREKLCETLTELSSEYDKLIVALEQLPHND